MRLWDETDSAHVHTALYHITSAVSNLAAFIYIYLTCFLSSHTSWITRILLSHAAAFYFSAFLERALHTDTATIMATFASQNRAELALFVHRFQLMFWEAGVLTNGTKTSSKS